MDQDVPIRIRPGLSLAIHRLAAGEEDAWSAIADLIAPRVYRQCLEALRDPHQAEDAVQEALLTVRTAAGGYRGLPDDDRAAEAWVRRIALNHAYAGMRQRLRSKRLDPAGDDPVALTAEPFDAVSAAELARLMRAELARLPADLARAVMLHDLQGMDYPELAAAEEITVDHARVRVHRGRMALRHRLASVVRQSVCRLLRLARARLTFSRMSPALAVQMKGFGS